jgi:tape measure domain-containing protein
MTDVSRTAARMGADVGGSGNILTSIGRTALGAIQATAIAAAAGIAALSAAFGGLVAIGFSTNQTLEQLNIRLETLARRELERGEIVTRTSRHVRELTADEAAEIDELLVRRQRLSERLEDAREDYEELGGAQAEVTAETEAAAAAVRLLDGELGTVQARIETLRGLEGTVFTTETQERIRRTDVSLTEVSEAARQTMLWIREMAVQTPFTVETLGSALAMSQAYGFTTEQAQRMVLAVGDTDAALGAQGLTMHRVIRALGQMQTRQRVASQEMLQMTEAGVPAWEVLADAMGVSTAELQRMVTAGLVPAGPAIDAIVTALEDEFGGAMEAQSRTMGGLRTAFSELIQLFAADVTLPLFERMRDSMAGIVDLLSSPAFQEATARLGAAIGRVVDALSRLIGTGGFGAIFAGFDLVGVIDNITALADQLARFIDIAGVISQMRGGDVLGGILVALREHGPEAFRGIAGAAVELLDYIREVIAMIAEIPARLAEFAVGAGITEALAGLGGAFANLGDAVATHAPEMGEALSGALDFLLDAIATVGPTIIENLTGIVDSIAELWREHGDTVISVISFAWNLIVATIGGAITLVSGIINAFLTALTGDWEGAWQALVESFNAFFELALSVVGSNLATFQEVWTTNWDLLRQTVVLLWENIRGAIATKLSEIQAAISSAMGSALSAVTGMIGSFIAAGAAIVQGIVDGIVGAAQAVVDAVTSIVGGAIQAARATLGIESPSKVFAAIGRDVMFGMAEGILQAGLAPKVALESSLAGSLIAPAATVEVITPPPSVIVQGGSMTTNIDRSITTGDILQPAVPAQRLLEDLALIQAMQ